MNSVERSQLLQVLHGRREAIADSWYKAIARTSHVPHSAAEVREHLVELTEQAIRLLLTEPFEHGGAQAIGASLECLHFVEPEALGRTQEILAQQLAEDLPADQVAALQPRLAALLGGLAVGFCKQARETTLAEQERIRNALTSELRRAEEALREAYDEVEQQVRERTAELRATNESLRREITERKRAEEALRESEEKYRNLVERANDGITVIQDTIVKYANPRLAEMWGGTVEEIIDTPFANHVHPDELPKVLDRYQRRMAGEDVLLTYETVLRRKDGSKVYAELNAGVVTYQGKPADLVIVRDITERKQVEEILRQSEERYRNLFEGVPVGLYHIGPDGHFLDVNQTMMKMLGYPDKESLLAVTTVDLQLGVTPEDRQRRLALLERYGTMRDVEVQLRRHDDGVIWGRSNFRAIRDAAGRVLYYEGSLEDITRRKRAEEALQKAHDELEIRVQERTAELAKVNQALRAEITERKRAEEALKASEERYRSLFEGVPVGLYRTTWEGQILDANSALVQMLGYPDRESLLALSATDVYVDPEDRRREQSLLKQNGVVRDFEMQVRRRDGRPIWVRDTARATRDADGRVLYYEGSLEDITERKRSEQYLLRTERLAAMGRLAAALAHEINNPLQAIGNSLELALDFPLQEKERQEYLQAARREIERLMILTDRVLNFARPPLVERQAISVADVVRHALALVSKELHNSDIRVSLDLPDVLPPVLTLSSHLSQVFLNLMINAIEAMPDGGELSIVVRLAGDQVEVTFADSGPGIPSDAMARLFEPFHTTKEDGTGLGLATSHSIIQQYGGTMTAGNAPGGGAVFTVALPVAPLDEPYVAERSNNGPV
ncbi:MAG: PAS domain S-box protein [Anaerolineae bacterium]